MDEDRIFSVGRGGCGTFQRRGSSSGEIGSGLCPDDYLLRIWKGPDETFNEEGFLCLFENESFTAES